MASRIYRNAKKLMLSGLLNLGGSNLYVMLLSGTYDGSTDTNSRTHTVTGDLAGHEVVGTAYIRGGQNLTSCVVGVAGLAGSNDEAYFDAADVTYSSSTITASGAVIWQSGGSASNAYLVTWLDLGANQVSSNGTFQIQWNSEGILNF